MTRVGFTGTRQGMNASQKDHLETQLRLLMHLTRDTIEFHHGDCIGADAEAAAIARSIGCRLIAHPPDNDAFRAFVPSDVTRPPKKYLARNHEIVDEVHQMFAAPKGMKEEKRGSGTWATIRYCWKKHKQLAVLPPDPYVPAKDNTDPRVRRTTPPHRRA